MVCMKTSSLQTCPHTNCNHCPARACTSAATPGGPPVASVSVTAEASERLREGLLKMHFGASGDPAEMLAAGRATRNLVSAAAPALAAVINSFRRPASAPDALFIAGLPDLGDDVDAGTALSLAMALLAGEPFQYSTQNGGRLVGILSPKPDFDGVPNTGESREEFAAHTDDAVMVPNYSTDLIQLVGMVNESQAETLFFPLTDILARLSKSDQLILRKPHYTFQAPRSFKLAAGYTSPPSSILFTDEVGRDMIRLPTYNCRPVDENDAVAQRALAEICRLANDSSLGREFVVGPGTALIFNNNRGLHSRRAFQGRRIVLRTYIRGTLDTLRAKAGVPGPIFDPRSLLAS